MNKPKQVALYDNTGFFVGRDNDYGGPLPHNSTHTLPEIIAGFVPYWSGQQWDQIEDHRGELGYVNGDPVTIDAPGPYPEEWSAEYVDPRTTKEIRYEKIASRLGDIDMKRIRPMAKILAGGDAEEDRHILAALESEAAELRTELAALKAENGDE